METKKSMILSEIKRNIMENEEYLCIKVLNQIPC